MTPRFRIAARRAAFLPAAFLSVAVLSVAGSGCGGDPPPPAGRVVLIGVDALDWSLLGPMIDAGELPALARFRERGVHGTLRSLEPRAEPAALWTTAVTGKSPDRHGVHTARRDGPPRTARPLWSILRGLDRGTGVVGWPRTIPAEPGPGFFVSDFVSADTPDSTLDPSGGGLVAPPSLAPLVASFDPPLDGRTLASLFRGTTRQAPLPAAPAAAAPVFRNALRADLWLTNSLLNLARTVPCDLLAVRLPGAGAVSRAFWNYTVPERFPPGALDPEHAGELAGAVPLYYRVLDRLLEPLLAEAGESTTVILFSAYGFEGGLESGPAGQGLDGVFLLGGRGAARGEISGASLYDVAPTVLVLLGLPPAEDMRGKVLWPALRGIPEERFAAPIPTYESGSDSAAGGNPMDDAVKERLRSLGYID